MKRKSRAALGGVLVALAILGATTTASAQDDRPALWLLGGAQTLNENDTAFPDDFVNVPLVLGVTYPVSGILAIEGEFSWMLPIEQSANVGTGESLDLKTPDILTYQASLRASLPVGGDAWRPYLIAGAGGATFLSNTDANRVPALGESETAFAVNFGAGVVYPVSDRWAVRADFRELVAFPSDGAAGMSVEGESDEVWMSRGTVGFGYRF
jgi:opacity protein-like surface antigen